MVINLIGAGNLATSLAVALIRAGHKIPFVFSRTMSSAKDLAEKVDARPVCKFDDIDVNADLFIIAVKDDIIRNVACDICERFPQSLLVHTAGAVEMDIISSKRKGVFYPMQTFSKRRIVDFLEIPIFVDSNMSEDLDVLKTLAKSISNKVVSCDDQQRKILHLAAVFCCNFTNHCAAIAYDILRNHSMEFDVMLPLINETIKKINKYPPKMIQTGPAVRHDNNVMNTHIGMLNNMEKKLWADIYKLMSKSIQS